MGLKTKKLEDGSTFLHYHYTERVRDSENKILPMLASNNAVITSETLVKLPDSSKVKAEPVIALLKAPPRSFPFQVNTPRIEFETGIFLHWRLFEDYIQTGNSNPDARYVFRMEKDGLSIYDVSKSRRSEFGVSDLKSFGIISIEWDYLDKAQKWFESDFKTPTGVKATGYFFTDVGKIPAKQIDGTVVKNSNLWVM